MKILHGGKKTFFEQKKNRFFVAKILLNFKLKKLVGIRFGQMHVLQFSLPQLSSSKYEHQPHYITEKLPEGDHELGELLLV